MGFTLVSGASLVFPIGIGRRLGLAVDLVADSQVIPSRCCILPVGGSHGCEERNPGREGEE